MRIIYLVPDNQKPSWGVGIIYHHVLELRKAGFDAWVMHQKKGFRLQWLAIDIPIMYNADEKTRLLDTDVLVVPEVMVNFPGLKKVKCIKVLFVQNLFYMFATLPDGETHKSLGFQHAMSIMPHMENVIATRAELKNVIVPPIIADYFYKEREALHQREKVIAVYPKNDSLDYGILVRFIQQTIKIRNHKTLLGRMLERGSQWTLIELKDKSHIEVAAVLKKASFFVSLNTTEAFNTAVPEAMAAGCINFCYEAFGPADFLKNNGNAFVFSNNHIYPLLEKLIDNITGYDNQDTVLQEMRETARETAEFYSSEKLAAPLLTFFNDIMNNKSDVRN